MKKLLLFFSALLVYTAMNAQIVTSRSVTISTKPVKKSETTKIWRVGIGTNTFTGDDCDDIKSKFGYNIGYEFNKSIKNKGAYWGMNFGLGSRGYKYEEDGYKETFMAHNIQWSPFTFGWKIAITEDIKIDPHAGAFVSADYYGKAKYKYDNKDGDDLIYDDSDYKYFDAGMNIGVGIWYKNFNLDLMYQKGFIGYTKDVEASASNFMVRFGIAY